MVTTPLFNKSNYTHILMGSYLGSILGQKKMDSMFSMDLYSESESERKPCKKNGHANSWRISRGHIFLTVYLQSWSMD